MCRVPRELFRMDSTGHHLLVECPHFSAAATAAPVTAVEAETKQAVVATVAAAET